MKDEKEIRRLRDELKDTKDQLEKKKVEIDEVIKLHKRKIDGELDEMSELREEIEAKDKDIHIINKLIWYEKEKLLKKPLFGNESRQNNEDVM